MTTSSFAPDPAFMLSYQPTAAIRATCPSLNKPLDSSTFSQHIAAPWQRHWSCSRRSSPPARLISRPYLLDLPLHQPINLGDCRIGRLLDSSLQSSSQGFDLLACLLPNRADGDLGLLASSPPLPRLSKTNRSSSSQSQHLSEHTERLKPAQHVRHPEKHVQAKRQSSPCSV
jgi:hypothetical protein